MVSCTKVEDDAYSKPWEVDVKGERMSVQEWTGPATFMDVVLSYLLVVGGMREQDLYGLGHPVQVGDVAVLPTSGNDVWSSLRLRELRNLLEAQEAMRVSRAYREVIVSARARCH